MPFVPGNGAVAVNVQARKLVSWTGDALLAGHLETAEPAVTIPIEPREGIIAAMPFVALYAAVSVDVEVIERVPAVVIHVRAQELRAVQRVIAIPIRPQKCLAVVVPFVRGDAAIAVVVETGEPTVGPGHIALCPSGVVVGLLDIAVLPCPGPDFISREPAVAVPVVSLERACRPAPLVSRDDAVVIGVHPSEPHLCGPILPSAVSIHAIRQSYQREGQQ